MSMARRLREVSADLPRAGQERTDRAAVLAAVTIRAVAMAVVGTAIVQTAIVAVGLFVSSVPGAGILAAAALILNLTQLGPWLVMLPAVGWKFYTGDSVWGFVLLTFAVLAGTIDNFLRPLLIRQGADVRLLLIFAGVIGGLISLGFMGVFVGPVILAVAFVLVQDWIDEQPETEKKTSA